MVWGLGFRVWEGSGLRGLGFRVGGFGLVGSESRVQDVGRRALGLQRTSQVG